MALIICPECKQQVSSIAKSCPHCGYDIQLLFKKRDSKDFKTGFLVTLGIIVIIIIIVILVPNDKKENVYTPNSSDAYSMAMHFVKENLKAPKTADFPTQTDVKITNEDASTFNIVGYVESENSFGALIRTNYTCKVRYVGNDNWQCVEIQFNE